MWRIELAVVGGGPAGLAAAHVASGNQITTLVLEAEARLGGQLHLLDHPVTDLLGVEAYDGADLAAQLIEGARALDVRLGARVDRIRVAERGPFELSISMSGSEADSQQTLFADAVLLAVGAAPRRLVIPGAALALGPEVSVRREPARWAGQRVAVIGGGDEAADTARVLAEGGADVVLLSRGPKLRARATARAMLVEHAIEVRTSAALRAIRPSQPQGARLRLELDDGPLEVDAAFARIGMDPAPLPAFEPALSGAIGPDPTGRTTIPRLYAAGDAWVPPIQRYIAIAAASGVRAVRSVEEDLRGP